MKQRRVLALVLSIILLISFVFPVSAATGYATNWKQDKTGKWYVQKADGSTVKNSWFCDDSDPSNVKWYILGTDGYMIENPLVQDQAGNYYSLEPSHNGNFGMMRNKSGVYDGINIVINETHNGTYGAIINQSAIDALKQKYGVVKLDINNSYIVYASKLVNTVSSSSSSSSWITPSTNVDITVPSNPGTYKYGVATLVVTKDTAEYTNLSGTAQNVKLTTSGQNIVINAPLDEFKHYGTAGSIVIKAVANASYYGYADAESMEAFTGHLSLNSNIKALSVEAEENIDIDVNKDAVIPSIYVNAEDGKAVDLTIGGDVKEVTSTTGMLTFTVEPTAKQTPKLEFVGNDAVAAYEKRMKEMMSKKKTFTVYLTHDGKTESYECATKYSEKYGTEVIDHEIEGRTFEKDVIVDGDFGKIWFQNCTFKGDIINRGNEQTIVRFFGCTFSENSKCRIENNGRKITIDDLIPKFMFILQNPIEVVCQESNGAALEIGSSSPMTFNGKTHTINDAEYFVDQRPDAYTTAIQEYEGQATGIYYYGEFNSLEGRKIIDLTVYDDAPIQRAYITINGEVTTFDPNGKSYEDTFTFATPSQASPSEGIYDEEVLIEAPYNTVQFEGFKFNEQVSIEGLYATVKFKNCDFNNKAVITKSPEIVVVFEDCINTPDPRIVEDIDEGVYLIKDGPVE